MAEHWEEHGLQVNLAFPDGRAYRLRTDGKAWPTRDDTGRPTVLGAGPLSFRCVEPFRTWTMTFEGQAVQTSTYDLVQGKKEGPWSKCSSTSRRLWPRHRGSREHCCQRPALSWRVGSRGTSWGVRAYEQLFRATGSVRTPQEEHQFGGSGLRIRRQGVRRLAEFRGHCWQSALFPSGRGFGYIAYPPREDGRPTFNEGYLFDGDGDLIPARVVEAPWLTRLQALGQDVSLVLETERGTVGIEGETVVSTYDVRHDDETWATQAMHQEIPQFPPLQQAGVRYRWNDEETYGMLERSYPADKMVSG